jgi:hypothetical protein
VLASRGCDHFGDCNGNSQRLARSPWMMGLSVSPPSALEVLCTGKHSTESTQLQL